MSPVRATACCSAALILLACSGDSRTPDPGSLIAGPSSSLDASGPSASGHANLVQLPSGALRTFSFQAHVMPDGSVQGELDNHNRQGGFVNHGDIDCMRLIGTNGAVMSGRSARSTNPASPEGSVLIFRVEDNGEGSDAATDRITLLLIFPPSSPNNCMNFTPPTLAPIAGGNLQVRP
jgi:hypothetical protein